VGLSTLFGSDDHCGRRPWNDFEPNNWSSTSGYVLPEADSGGLVVESGGTSVEEGSFGRLGIVGVRVRRVRLPSKARYGTQYLDGVFLGGTFCTETCAE